ncbi:MAG TPA: CvpA family protein [Rhizomicrobium sp.]|jgi:membrane protein required for colicin V production
MNLSVTFIDCLIVLIVVVSAGYAAWRGFLWETLTIFAWVSAAFACLYFGPYLIPMMHSMVSQGWLASLLAYAGAFLAVFIPLAFMTARFSESVKNSPIGPLDRAAGVAFGIVRGLVIVGLAYLAFTYFVPIRNQPHWLTEARLLPVVQSTADVLLSVVPDHPRDYTYIPKHDEEVRQAPPPAASHDPMADLIRRNEAANTVPKSVPKPANTAAQHRTAARVTKSYGASDREALDNLVKSGGNSR